MPAEATLTEKNSQPAYHAAARGSLIINADDWGRDSENTSRIFACLDFGTVSSASGMVFMADSVRAADLAREHNFDIGLHLNFTSAFTVPVTGKLVRHLNRVAHYLRRHRLSQVVYHPGLADSFAYLVAAQLEEFQRIYGHRPDRIDGHHHMHLCANVLIAQLLPEGTIARRNFSFQPGEKSGVNRLYRRFIDRRLAKRHRLTDYFFSLPPLDPRERLQRIYALAASSTVEVECHPINPEEYKFLAGGEILRLTGGQPVANAYHIVSGAA
jgi:predicted glycoside hydrolase/deacetylase ChbG (UPF0249 family)